MSACTGNPDCACVHCGEVRKHERQKIAVSLRERADQFMPTDTNNQRMRKACAFNLAEAVERCQLESA